MKKILIIPLLLLSAASFSQTSTTESDSLTGTPITYTGIFTGDSAAAKFVISLDNYSKKVEIKDGIVITNRRVLVGAVSTSLADKFLVEGVVTSSKQIIKYFKIPVP